MSHRFNYHQVRSGLLIMAWGFFKKVVVADRAASIANSVFNSPDSFSGPFYIAAVLLFAVQIYCDFSGYSDIAVGVARIMGIDLMTNFRMPYFSKSIGEFWSRWHISLSTWFRDYLYIPLGGNRCSIRRLYANILIVFVVSGLWHGANWTFVIWGALNGIYLLLEIISGANKRNPAGKPWLSNCWRMVWTFSLTNLAWIFFRANTVQDAFYILLHLPDGFGSLFANASNGAYLRSLIGQLGVERSELYILCGMIGLLWVTDGFLNTGKAGTWFYRQPVWIRWGAYYGLIAVILCFGAFNTSQQFIYFQF
jgi:D-alanyl-lipoteichoic acid acyltransferase DltB (MBOAT superfamily)